MGFFLLDPQGPPSWAGLSSFPLPSYSSLLLKLLVDSCSLPGVCSFYPYSPSSGGHDVPYSTHRWSSEGNNDSPFLPIMFSMGRDYGSYARPVLVSPVIMCLIFPLIG